MAVDPLPGLTSPAPIGALSGERRQITALFYDIVGSTELLGRLDPEDYAGLQRRLHTEAVEAIEAAGGRIDRLQGDGGCAYFGLPVPLEDAAESAVACGLELIARCRGLEQGHASPLKVRIGIATGTVVVAQTALSRLPGSEEIVGIPPALAARIQAEAEPNGVMVADSTYRLTLGAFAFEPVGIRQLKGFAEPVRLWRPVARRPHMDRFSASRRVTAPLIGRASELDTCRQCWSRACTGTGLVLAVHGEAGIGKSRLLAELRQEIADGDCDVAVFQCQPRGNSRPLHPFLDSLKQILATDAGAEIDATGIAAYFRANGAEIPVEHARTLEFLCGQGAGQTELAAWSSDASADDVRDRSRDAVLHYLACWTGPRLIVIEDVHWADSLTEAVLMRIPEVIAGRPILVVVTSRDVTTVESGAAANVTSLHLTRLDEAAITLLLASIWTTAPPAGLAAFIHEKSDGVPLFAEQLAFLLKEATPSQGADPDHWRRSLPESGVLNLQDLIAARLSGLGPLRRLAQIASVIGREFDSDTLARLVDADLGAGRLEPSLRELARAGIVDLVAAGGRSAYRFRHVLIQQSAYGSLLRADRRELHERIVRLLTSGAASVPSDEIMGWHFEQAGQPLPAARHAIRAAEACLARSAMREADHLLDTAQRQLDLCDPAADEVKDLLLQLLATRGPVAAALFGRGSPQAGAVYEQGVDLCHARGSEDRARWLPLYWGWWFTAPDFETQKARAAAVVSDLEAVTDPEARLQSLHCAWASNFEAGRHAYCLHCVDAGLRLYDPERARWSRAKYGGHDAKVCGLGERALSLWFSGDDAGSAESIGEALAWAETTGHRDSIFHALDYAVCLARYQNDYRRVLAFSERMAAMAEEHAMPDGTAKARLFGGWASAMMDGSENGFARFDSGFATMAAIGTEENSPIYREMKAELLARAGRQEEALSILEQAIETSSRNGQVFWLPELYRRRGLLRRALGWDRSAYGADFEHAVALATDHGAVALAARARAELTRLGAPPPGRP